jgi:hypothetical protein
VFAHPTNAVAHGLESCLHVVRGLGAELDGDLVGSLEVVDGRLEFANGRLDLAVGVVFVFIIVVFV